MIIKQFISAALLIVSNLACAELQVTGLQDYQFGHMDCYHINRINHSLCVYSSDRLHMDYRVRVYSTGKSGSFVMSNGISQMPYQLEWSPLATGGAGYVSLIPNTAVQMSNASSTRGCAGRDNANLQISINPQALDSLTAGAYSTTLNIVVEPI